MRIAETAIFHAAVKLGIGVFRPLTDGERYDLIFDFNPQLAHVQCKWAPRHGDVVVVRCYSARRGPEGLRRRGYTAAEVGAIAAYCPQTGSVYWVPAALFDGHLQLHLRLAPNRNNQRSLIHWASDHELGATIRPIAGP